MLACLVGYRLVASSPGAAQLFDLWVFYAAVVTAFWFTFGAAGQFSFAQAAFVGIGTYTGNKWFGQNFWAGVIISGAICAVLGAMVSVLLRRATHFAFAIATLGVAQILGVAFQNWDSFTGGISGVVGGASAIPFFGQQWQGPTQSSWVIIGLLSVCMLLRIWFMRSPGYREAVALRDNPRVAETGGVQVLRVKVTTFAAACGLAGCAGAVYIHWNGFTTPDGFGLDFMIAIFLMCVLGGVGSLWGPLLGAWFYTYGFQILSVSPAWQDAIYGGVLVLVILLFPTGLVGLVARLAGFLRRRPAEPVQIETATQALESEIR